MNRIVVLNLILVIYVTIMIGFVSVKREEVFAENIAEQYLTEPQVTTMSTTVESSTESTTNSIDSTTTTVTTTTTETTTVVETTTETTTAFYPTRFTDLGNKGNITEEDMRKILEYWHNKNGTPFYGQEKIFIKAGDVSGLDPVYILSHSATESKWGKSHLGKHNYFGIGAYDYDPVACGYTMGDSMESGIVSGAVWIKNHFYDMGQSSLNLMIHHDTRSAYATAGDDWIDTIESIMQTSYDVIRG